MAKQKKTKKRKNSSKAAEGPVKAQLRRFNWKQLCLIVLSTALAFSIYEALITLNFLPISGIPIIMPVYFIITAVLLCAVLILNSGISTKKITPEMLHADEGEDPAHLEEICARLNARKDVAKKLMLVLLPFLFAILFDVIYLFYGDFFLGAISALGGK